MPRHNIKVVVDKPIQDIFDLLDNQLLRNNITIVGIKGRQVMQGTQMTQVVPNHITTIAKNKNGDVILYEGQLQRAYVNTEIITYLQNYETFNYWCNKIKNKRTFDDIVSTIRNPRPELHGSPTTKKRKIGSGGGKIKRRRHRTKRTKRRRRHRTKRTEKSNKN